MGRTGRPPSQKRSADAADFISLPPELLQLCAGQLPCASDVAALALCSQALCKLLMNEARARRRLEEEQAAALKAAQAHKTAAELAFQPQFLPHRRGWRRAGPKI